MVSLVPIVDCLQSLRSRCDFVIFLIAIVFVESGNRSFRGLGCIGDIGNNVAVLDFLLCIVFYIDRGHGIVYCGSERSFHASTTLILYTGKVTWKLVTDSMEFTRRHEGMKYLLQEHWGFNSVPLELDNLHHRIRSTTSPPNLTLNLRTQTDKSHHRERPPSPS